MDSTMTATWSFPASRDFREVSTGHVIDPASFYVAAVNRPEWAVEMEEGLAKHVKG